MIQTIRASGPASGAQDDPGEVTADGGDLVRVAVFGAGGYAGMLLSRLLARHPAVNLVLLASERLSSVDRSALDGWLDGIPILAEHEAVPACTRLGVKIALLATPVEVSLTLAPLLLSHGMRVLNLSGAFRLPDPALFEEAYGMRHTASGALSLARYALPEVTGMDGLRETRLVANPGCYVTAALLALAPLCRHGLLRPGAPVFIDGKSGSTGAGRKAAVELSLAELEGDLRPYRLGHHQHTPEIVGVLQQLGGATPGGDVVFVPHLLGTRRGLLVTCHGQLVSGFGGPHADIARRAREAFAHDYAGCARVHLVAPEEVTLRRPVGTPDAWVGLHVGERAGTFTAVASLDNLMKGAASQAIQNLNGMLGLGDATGLDSVWSAA